ncbi:DUF4142 domain-containing protein [Modicisalibacter xianhensis]|uniref:DUF4142 domain-containing protein n=1 Tax=Modicisalibacter xianhensis TaxID=442341 RepID=A0A1I3AD71_9GAMM|nr:DUF4142 domain-containing protein [Halomonas xianhensis]SFH48018.1 protein of unknown function [Halomonas xianhensis]
MQRRSGVFRPAIVALGVFLGLAATGCSTPSQSEPETNTATTAEIKPESMTSGEILYVLETINLGEAEQAELALQHSRNNEVTQLARRILQDHTASSQAVDELEQAVETDTESASSSISEGIQFQVNAFLEDMAGLTGYEFNKTYLEKQVVLHEVSLDVVRTQLIPGADEPAVLDYLESYRDMLEKHREQAQQSLKDVL